MSLPRFEVFQDTKGEYRFRLLSKSNGQNILRSSEGYTTKQNCMHGIASIKINAPFDSQYDRKQSTNYQHYFVLKAGNGEPLGMSEMYTTTAARENGISAVKRDAPGAPIKDLTLVKSGW